MSQVRPVADTPVAPFDARRGRGIRVCIHVPLGYPVLVPGTVPIAGGLETQQAIVARGLAARGFEVHFVTGDYGQPATQQVGDLIVHRTFAESAGLPGIRFVHPRLTSTVAALRAARADIYLMQGSGPLAGFTFETARGLRTPFVLSIAHDDDVRKELPRFARMHDRWLYRRALTGAALRIAQSEWQRERLKVDYGLDSVVLPNPIRVPERAFHPERAGDVLWIATYKASKRPEWFVELARRVPEQRFVMHGVVPPSLDPSLYNAAKEAARRLPNLEVLDQPVHDRLDQVYESAALFVHTSVTEGFPNTFLEAWARGIPGVTTFDPDGLISRQGLGQVVGDQDALVRAVRDWLASPDKRREAGARARAYASLNHDQERVLDRVADLLLGLLKKA